MNGICLNKSSMESGLATAKMEKTNTYTHASYKFKRNAEHSKREKKKTHWNFYTHIEYDIIS